LGRNARKDEDWYRNKELANNISRIELLKEISPNFHPSA
jgi:hypothetical protein